MAKRKPKKQQITDYRHDATRKNIPPAGLAAHGKVAREPQQRYTYDPHLPPVLRFDIRRLHTDPDLLKDADRIHGRTLLRQRDAHRFFILGKPGAGKTTFLKYLTLQAVRGEINKISIFISLKSWADSGLNLLPFLARQFEICDFPAPQPHLTHNHVHLVTSDFHAHSLLICLDPTVAPETITQLDLAQQDIFICLDTALTDQAKVRLSDTGNIHVI